MRPRTWPLIVTSLALTLAGCQFPQSNTSGFTTNVVLSAGTTGGDETVSSSGTTAADGGSSASSESVAASGNSGTSGDTGVVLDVGAVHDAGDGTPAGCKGKIDFLFVISRYGTMKAYQDKLVAAFPAFIDTIEAKFADFDYHIMVVDGDPNWGLDTCDELCPKPCGVPDYPCDYAPSTCDLLTGTGTVFPAGGEASNKLCGIADGRRYMIKSQPNLKETFSCIARVGMSGGDDLGEALTAAVDHNLNGPGGCNGGFLRKDALLMVTLISNTYDTAEPPGGSKGTPESWHEAVVAAKSGDPNSVVMFGFLDPTYAPGCHPKDRMCQMVRMFPYSLIVQGLDDNYPGAFAEAVTLVDTACAGFVPPG
jgi:hypothetical protein